MLSFLTESVIRRPRSRLRGAYWHLRQWLPGAVRVALRGSREFPVRPGELGAWLDEAHAGKRGDLTGRRLLVFSYLPWWIDFTAAVSACLVGRGADVTFAWLPYWTFYEETPRRDEEIVGRYEPILGRSRPRFRGVNLCSLSGRTTPPEELMRRMAYVDTQYVQRREEVDIVGDDNNLFEFRLRRLRHAYGAFTQLLDERSFDSVLVPNGGVLEFAASWHAAHDAGVGNITLESWERLGTCAIGYGRPCFDEIAKELWATDSHRLDAARRSRVERSMRERENPDWSGHVISYQNAAIQGASELRAQLGLDERRPVALVCPNVPYDAAFLGLRTGFKSMADWLRTLLRQLAARPDWQTVIRAHPGESALASRQSAESILRSAIPPQLENIHFISPETKLNTYALMRIANAGFVFGSTTGLEMAARGLSVVVPVETHYSQKGFTRDAFTREGYSAAVAVQLDERPRLAQEDIDLAWCYLDVYMNQWCRPFPWALPTFAHDIREWPLTRVLGSEGSALFDDTFTILAGGERSRTLISAPPSAVLETNHLEAGA